MLKSLDLSNFKAHDHIAVAEFRPFSVIVGRNNSGKSSVLQALAWARYGDWFRSVNQTLPVSRDPSTETRIQLSYTPSGGGATALQTWSTRLSEAGLFAAEPGDDLVEQIRYVGLPRSAPYTYPFGPFSTDTEAGQRSERVWQVLREMRDMDPDARDRVDYWAQKIIGGLTRLRTPAKGAEGAAAITRSFGRDVDVFRQGSGVGSALPLVIQGVLCQAGQCLLVEEPDDHLHSGAIREMVEFLRDLVSRGVQVICTTHSVDLVSEVLDWAYVSDAVGTAEGPAKGPFGLYELSIDSDGRTEVVFGEPSDPKAFKSIRRSLQWGV